MSSPITSLRIQNNKLQGLNANGAVIQEVNFRSRQFSTYLNSGENELIVSDGANAMTVIASMLPSIGAASLDALETSLDTTNETALNLSGGGGGGGASVVDNLVSGGAGSALSAQQGVVLKNLVDGIGERKQVADNAALAASTEPDGTTFFVTDDGGTGEWGLYQRIAGADTKVLGQSDLVAAVLALSDPQALDNTDTTTGLIQVGKQLYDVILSYLLDEDDLLSNSDTQGATQQSIKAYIDALMATHVIDLHEWQATPIATQLKGGNNYRIQGDGLIYADFNNVLISLGQSIRIMNTGTGGALIQGKTFTILDADGTVFRKVECRD